MAKWTLPPTYSVSDNLTTDDIEELISDSQLLTCLMELQVHKWEHYNEAFEMFKEITELKG
jgi:hypothetical protein